MNFKESLIFLLECIILFTESVKDDIKSYQHQSGDCNFRNDECGFETGYGNGIEGILHV